MTQAIECDNCKATGSLRRTQVKWSDGLTRLRPDVNSYFSISKSRYDRATEPFETLHFCTLSCLVEYAPSLAQHD